MEDQPPSEARDLKELFRLGSGRDELNLAEFPITLLSDRVPKGRKTLVFEDEILDRRHGETITRRVTVTGSDAYGLPTAIDDEVLIALVQVTKLDGFRDPKVSFSRHELLRILGWKDAGKNYRRIEEALNRWMGVTLYYENAWWDNQLKAWVNAKFHILDNVQVLSQKERARLSRRGQLAQFSSWFKWNEVVFKSFRADNLKRLDLDTYFNLKSPTAKRMLRFLDKRFYRRGHWEFDLKEFAFEHIGLARSYDTGQIKAKLQPGLEELEARGFLEPLSREERYTKEGRGLWKIVVVKAKPGLAGEGDAEATAPDESSEADELIGALQRRGVTAARAAELVLEFSPEQVRRQIEVFDWLIANQDERVTRSPAGYLVKSIQNAYEPPEGFESREDRAKRPKAKAKARTRRGTGKARRRVERKAQPREDAEAARIKAFWESLSPQEQEIVRGEALAQVPSFLAAQFLRHEKTDPERAEFYWKVVLGSFLSSNDEDEADSEG